MKKKTSLLLVLFLSMTMMVASNVAATPGRLKASSIVTCKGVKYGKHADHWHVAVKKGNYYYASGNPVPKPSCAKVIVG